MSSFTLNQVRSITNTGMVLKGSTYDPCYSKGWMNTIPNISINGNTCYFDYSDTYDSSDRTLLTKIFSTIPVGTSVYVEPIDYYDELKNIRTALGGTFTYSSSFNSNKVIVGTVVSGFTFSTSYNFYDKINFVKPIQFTLGYTGGATAANYIIYSLPNKNNTSFSNSGILGSVLNFEEYIEISGSTLNSGRLRCYGFIKLKDSQELLYTVNTLTNEDLFTAKTTLKYFIRGTSNVGVKEKPEGALGAFTVYDQNLLKQDCYDNQNEYQTFLRSQSLGNTYYGYWLPCQSCGNFVESASYANNGNRTLFYANSIYFSIAQLATTVNNVTTSPFAVYTNRSYTAQSSLISAVTLASSSSNVKLDISHPSLQGWSVDIFTDPDLTQKLSTSFYRSGTPGFDQSYILLLYGQYLPKTVYCVFDGPTKLTVTLSV
jgi:hypothetical protein